jgi:uncharacterized membrane protein (UPF0127 family)
MRIVTASALLAVAALSACHRTASPATAPGDGEATTAQVTISTGQGARSFTVDVAATAAAQERGLMYRTDIPDDGGMLFAPYPPGGGGPARASFWMKNTPTPLDIIFIRPDHTIARIADNAVPFDQTPISSGEPVDAVLEVKGGRSSALGIETGDTVRWSLTRH